MIVLIELSCWIGRAIDFFIDLSSNNAFYPAASVSIYFGGGRDSISCAESLLLHFKVRRDDLSARKALLAEATPRRERPI